MAIARNHRLPPVPEKVIKRIKELYFEDRRIKNSDGSETIARYTDAEIATAVNLPVAVIETLASQLGWNHERQALIVKKKTSTLAMADAFEQQEAQSDTQMLIAAQKMVMKLASIVDSGREEVVLDDDDDDEYEEERKPKKGKKLDITSFEKITNTLIKLDTLQQNIQKRIKEEKIATLMASGEDLQPEEAALVLSRTLGRLGKIAGVDNKQLTQQLKEHEKKPSKN